MTHKKVNNSDPGTDIVFGGNDLDKWSDWASGVDTDDYDINSDFTVRSAKRYLRNPANTFSYQEIGSAITANRTVTEPLLTGNDTRVYQAHAQTLTNKTISGATNTLSSIPVNSLSNFAVSAPTTNQVLQYNGTSWVNATSAGGTGAGFSAGGSINKSGDGVTNTVTIAHGLSTPPDVYFAFPLNAAARGSISYSVDATNITLTYPIAPAEGTNNLSYVWGAGYVNIAAVGLSAVSTTTLTNKDIDIATNTLKLRLYSYIIFKSGTTFYAISSAGAVLSSGSVPETVIQAALTIGGTIFIADGTYDLSAGFSGFTIGTQDHIILGRAVTIRVPNGYNGVMWNIPAPTSGSILEGGVHGEQGTPARNWTWVRMHAPTSGVYGNIVQDCVMSDAGIGIKLYISSLTGWINNNWFKFLKMTNCVIFVDFDYDSTLTWPNTESTGFFDTHFVGMYCQCNASTLYGFKNISHKRNTFIDCNVWDAGTGNGGAGAITANFTANSSANMVVGGIFTNLNFADLGTNNMIWTYSSDFTPAGNINMGSAVNVIKFSNDVILKRHAPNVLTIRNGADSAYNSFRAEGLEGTFLRSQAGTTVMTIGSNTLTMGEAKDFALGTTTGTKIGTATTQKLSFYNATPVVQPTAISSPTADVTSLKTAVDAIRTRLTSLGLTA